jgi:hypothetical protein
MNLKAKYITVQKLVVIAVVVELQKVNVIESHGMCEPNELC